MTRCTAMVPIALWGLHDTPARCLLEDPADGCHTGNHRAVRKVKGLGKTVYRWKPKALQVQLPHHVRYAVGGGRMVRCACPEGYIGHQHLRGMCPLGG